MALLPGLNCAMFQHSASILYLRDATLFELKLLQSYRQLFKKYNPKCKQDSGVHQFSYQTHESSFLMPSKVFFQFYRQKDEMGNTNVFEITSEKLSSLLN